MNCNPFTLGHRYLIEESYSSKRNRRRCNFSKSCT
ncbi:MAG: hypothetical protein LBM93_01355 [Oscillospiraceae bacterium]|nr:hypothetical protein [Oscillospiraceae bacterium]